MPELGNDEPSRLRGRTRCSHPSMLNMSRAESLVMSTGHVYEVVVRWYRASPIHVLTLPPVQISPPQECRMTCNMYSTSKERKGVVLLTPATSW